MPTGTQAHTKTMNGNFPSLSGSIVEVGGSSTSMSEGSSDLNFMQRLRGMGECLFRDQQELGFSTTVF